MKIQTSTDSSWFGHCIPVVFASQTWLQMLFQWYANISVYSHYMSYTYTQQMQNCSS